MHYQCSKLQTFGPHGKWKINLATKIKVKSCQLVTKILTKVANWRPRYLETKNKKQKPKQKHEQFIDPWSNYQMKKPFCNSQICKNLPKMSSAW